MSPDETQQIITDQTAAARQLRAGFPWLGFEHDLEREFRREQARTRLPQIRFNLYLVVVIIVVYSGLSTLVLPAPSSGIYVVQFGLILPIAGLLLWAAHRSNGFRLYPRIAPLLAPIGGLAVAAVDLKASQSGVPLLFSSLLLCTIFTYCLLGLLFYEAVRTNLIVWGAYLAFGIVVGLSEAQLIYNCTMLLMANVVGATVAYSFERLARTHFLEAKLLSETAARDGLTGIYNRRRFNEHLETVWHHAQRDGVTLALLLVDIDFFKRFNDRHGHQAGDECLGGVAAALARAARRPLDFVARYGGEEFAVILYDPSREYLREVANRIHANVAAMGIEHGDSSVASTLTVSIGMALVAPTLERSAAGFVQLADEALYEAKADGRNRTKFSEVEYYELETGSFRAARRVAG